MTMNCQSLSSFTCLTFFFLVSCLLLVVTESSDNFRGLNPVSEKLAAEKNLTVQNGFVVLHSVVGDVLVPVPPANELQLTHGRVKRDLYSHSPYYVRDMADFFSCSEQAQYALSPFGDNARNWDAFFKRNSINNTIAVRYCCNLLEYVNTAEQQLSYECRYQVRLEYWVMMNPVIRYNCREYEFDNVQCFLVRWMYWWIPLLIIGMIVGAVFGACFCLNRGKNKSQL